MKFNTIIDLTKRYSATLALTLLLTLSISSAAVAGSAIASKGDPLNKSLEDGLGHLFSMSESRAAVLDMTKIGSVIDFVANCNTDPKDLEPIKRNKAKGIILRVDLKADLDRVLRFLYNPDIPNHAILPSVLRLSGWQKDSDILKLKKGLWDMLPDLKEGQAVQLWGNEFEVNTPDQFGGAYYRYDMNRYIVMTKYQGKNVLISVSEQKNKSDVGKKGVIIDDKNWVYFYSDIPGIDKGLISWMDTFMYYSASVQVYVEYEPGKTRDVLFKWLHAGWAGANVVQRKHIYTGSVRFAEGFRKVLESDMISADEFAAEIRKLRKLPKSEIDAKIATYARAFETQTSDNKKMKKKLFAKVVADGGYAKVLNDEDRMGILVLQKLKCMLGMPTYVDLCEPTTAEDAKPEPVAAKATKPAPPADS